MQLRLDYDSLPKKVSVMRDICRLVIHKFLSSDVVKHIDATKLDEIKMQFLAEDPVKSFSVSLLAERPAGAGAYRESYGSLEVRFLLGNESDDVQDPQGNIWALFQVSLYTTITAAYSQSNVHFLSRLSAYNAVANFIQEVKSIAPAPMNVMILDNEQRLERDKKRCHDALCQKFHRIIDTERAELRRNLRVGGRMRQVSREFFADFTPGIYDVEVYDSCTSRRAKYKQYSLLIPKSDTSAVFIKRTR